MSHISQQKENTSVINQQSEIISQVAVGTIIGTTVPAHIGSIMYDVLIDTEATRSCMSKNYYITLMQPTLKQSSNFSVRSASGENLYPIVLFTCTFHLGTQTFTYVTMWYVLK